MLIGSVASPVSRCNYGLSTTPLLPFPPVQGELFPELLREPVIDYKPIEQARAMSSLLEPGDILCFDHRMSRRSQIIKQITRCHMPHFCVYAGQEKIVGMLKGLVRVHPLHRFYRPGYDIRIVRAVPKVLEHARAFIGQKEFIPSLVVVGSLALLDRYAHLHAHEVVPYPMVGVTCSGIVSTAVHRAFEFRSKGNPMRHTPADLEKVLEVLNLETLAVQST